MYCGSTPPPNQRRTRTNPWLAISDLTNKLGCRKEVNFHRIFTQLMMSRVQVSIETGNSPETCTPRRSLPCCFTCINRYHQEIT